MTKSSTIPAAEVVPDGTKPLAGKRVVVTRARAQAGLLSDALTAVGALPIEIPAIRIVAPEDGFAALDAAIAVLESFDWVVFTSVNGVEQFWLRLQATGRTIEALAQVRVAAIGSATADALASHGVTVETVPDQFVAERLLDALKEGEIAGKRFLLPRADIAREALHRGLVAAGADVVEVHAYRTIAAQPDPAALVALREGVDVITFTSSSTARNFVAQLGADEVQRLAETSIIAAIGPITARTIRSHGLRVDVVAEEYTMPGLVEALVNFFGADDPVGFPDSWG